jgi:ABC-type branched-subunit amino acid transport system ATPase component
MGGETFLQVRNISKSFGGVKAVRDVSISLSKGEILGIIGPNGSGKTTLVNLITGFVKPDAGLLILALQGPFK